MKRLVIGVIGHVDHGKTALVRALTGQDTDRLPEEKARGISIALGFAHLDSGDTRVDLIDMPGHERFVRTMISGATGLDAVLLVVAANEGIKPQTIEHVDIASLLGVRRALIAITKIDLVTPEHAIATAEKAAQLLSDAGFTPSKRILVSVRENHGITALRDALLELAAHQRPRPEDGLVFLPIDRAFPMVGHGPVVTGTLRGGKVGLTDTLELLPARKRVRVRSIQVHGTAVDAASPGQRVALNLRDVEMADLDRGMALARPETLPSSDWLTLSMRAVTSAPALKNGMRLRALFGTNEIDVRLRLLDRDIIAAGASAFAQLHCDEAVAIPSSEHVALQLISPPRTVAGGKILEATTRRLRRNDANVLGRLSDLRDLPSESLIAAEVMRSGTLGATLKQLSQLTALTTERVRTLLQPLPVAITRTGVVVGNVEVERVLARIHTISSAYATGVTREKLLASVPGTSLAVLDEAIARLVASGSVVERGKQLLTPRPDEDRARTHDEAEIAAQIAEQLQAAGLRPPNPGEIVTSAQAKRAVDRLLRERIIVRAVDRAKGREMLFHRDAISEAERKLAPILSAPGLLVTEIGSTLGISRRFSMPLLDHLDAIGFTRRVHDRRVRGPKA